MSLPVRAAVLGLVWLGACASTHEQHVAPHDLDTNDPKTAATATPTAPLPAPVTPAVMEKPVAHVEPAPPPPPPPSVLGEGNQSLLIDDDVRVFASASSSADVLGAIAGGTRLGIKTIGTASGKCTWYELDTLGWICAKGKPVADAPFTAELPALWNRGYDGKVYKDTDDIRAKGGHVPGDISRIVRPFPAKTTDVDGKKYMTTESGDLVPQSAVPTYWGDEFHGLDIGGKNADGSAQPTLPLAWTWYHDSWKEPTPVRDEPSKKGNVVRKLGLRERLSVLEETKGWIRVGDHEWVAREDVRIARQAEPPADVTGADEVWVDVVLDEETLVMYRGKTPIHATLVSTGRPEYGTPTGIFHIKKKTAVTAFDSPRPDLVDYHIKDVAWVMHITDIFAIHGAWWNRGFGAAISLGCIDMPASDIRTVYQTVEPKIQHGWTQAFATTSTPGSLVRIRSH